MFGLHAAEGARGFDVEGGSVDADNGFVVARNIDFAVVPDNVAWAALPHVDLFDAFAGEGVDYLDGVGGKNSSIESAAVVDEVLGEVADAAAVIDGKPVEDDGVAVAVEQTDFCIVAAPGAFAEQVNRGGGVDRVNGSGNGFFLASDQQEDGQQGYGENVFVHK